MADSFEMQKRYFQVQLDLSKKHPGLHKNKIEDCNNYIKALDEAGSPAAFKRYVQQTGNMLSTGKSEIKDRYENRAAIYEALGQKKKVQADRERITIIDNAQTHKELAEKLESFEYDTELSQAENKAIGAVCAVMKAIFHLATDMKGSGGEKTSLANLKAYLKLLKEADSEVTWSKLTTYPPYRDRLIFTGEQLSVLKKTFEEVKNGR